MDITRRTTLKIGATGFLGALLSRYVPVAADPAKARAIILLWLNGGPSHLDTWDPKPGTANGGSFKAIKTRNPALSLVEHMPHIAEVGDRLTVIRGMSSKEGNHARAQYLMHTGYVPNPTVVHPSLGAWVSKKLGAPASGLPAFVSLGGPSQSAGFLGVQHGPFVVPKAGGKPDNATALVDDPRFERRLKLLDGMESDFSQSNGGGKIEDRRQLYTESRKLMTSKGLDAFDVTSEPDSVKKAYGETDFGKACLVARRLVANGVRFVEVVLDGWDTHQNNFERVKKLLGVFDPAMGTLIKDLENGNLLQSTLVMCMGDFGRTPKINANDGRDHYPQAWSCVLAGGGTKPGVIGATDPDGTKPVGKAWGVADVMATAATAVGMKPAEELMSPVGRPIAITDSGTIIDGALK